MPIQRYTTRLPYDRLLSGLRTNFDRLLTAQNQISSGYRVTKPSDDPQAAGSILRGQRELSQLGATRQAIDSGRDLLDSASSGLSDVSGLLSEARALLLQGLNGTLDDGAREVLATQFSGLKTQLLEMANGRVGDRYLFAGTSTGKAPFVEQGSSVSFVGDGFEQSIEVGGSLIPLNLSGDQIFARFEPSGVELAGQTGLGLGTTANQGLGESEVLIQRTGSDLAALSAFGIQPVNGGGSDTFLGSKSLVIDSVAGTIQLGDGPALPLPTVGSPEAQDFVLTDESGESLHLDLSGFVPQDVSEGVSGGASIQIGSGPAVAVTFDQTDLTLIDPDNGNIVHVDTSAVVRAGSELVHYSGAADIFSVLESIAQDLDGSEAFNSQELGDRLNLRLSELIRHEDNVSNAVGVLGARSRRLDVAGDRYQNLELRSTGRLADLRETDLAQAVTELSQAEQAVNLSQAAGVRLLSLSLLNYLR